MNFWNIFLQKVTSESKIYTTFYLPVHRVDVDYDTTPMNAGEAYCRLWLAEMRLAQGVKVFTRRYPVVHAAIRFDYGGQTVTIPYIAGPGYLKELTEDNLDKIIQGNYPLTPLFPYNQGLVELQAGLFSMVADDPIGRFIKTLSSFSALLPVPELSAVLNLAGPVYSGIEDLLGTGDGRLELGYQQTFTAAGGGGSNDLSSGYFAVIVAEENKFDTSTLCVVKDRLRVGALGNAREFINRHQALHGYSYMLFRIEKHREQDWESLNSIRELVDKAREATMKGQFDEVKQNLLPAIKVAVLRSKDVAYKDRLEMFLKIENELRKWGLQATQREVPVRSLYSIMQQPLVDRDEATEAKLIALEHLLNE